jgi:hypothetical protein
MRRTSYKIHGLRVEDDTLMASVSIVSFDMPMPDEKHEERHGISCMPFTVMHRNKGDDPLGELHAAIITYCLRIENGLPLS